MREEIPRMAREVHDALNESLAHALDLIGLGIDVVDVAWSERLLEQHPTRLTRMYTEAELEYCRQKVQPAPYLAARMAAKEAVLKALGTGLVGGMAWHEVEITREEPGGKPGVQLHGEVRREAEAAGVTHWVISMTHRGAYAAAIAAALGKRRDRA